MGVLGLACSLFMDRREMGLYVRSILVGLGLTLVHDGIWVLSVGYVCRVLNIRTIGYNTFVQSSEDNLASDLRNSGCCQGSFFNICIGCTNNHLSKQSRRIQCLVRSISNSGSKRNDCARKLTLVI